MFHSLKKALWFHVNSVWLNIGYYFDKNYAVLLQLQLLQTWFCFTYLYVAFYTPSPFYCFEQKKKKGIICQKQRWSKTKAEYTAESILRMKHFTTGRICHWPCHWSYTCPVDLPEVNLCWQTGCAGGRAIPWWHQCHHQTELYLWRCLR